MAWSIPTIHPAAVLRGGRPITDVIAADLAKAWRVAERGTGPALAEFINPVIPGNPMGLPASFELACRWLSYWNENSSLVTVDVETSSLDFFNGKLYSIAVAEPNSEVGISFTLKDFHTLPYSMEARLTELTRAILANPLITKGYHNSPFDRAVLSRKGFRIAGPTMDTAGLAHLIQPDAPKNLGWVGHTYLECEPWKLDHDSGKMANTRDPVKLLVYNARDALYDAYCILPMVNTILNRGMSRELIAWQMAFADLATAMEIRGLPVNVPLRRMMGKALLADLNLTKRKLRALLAWPDFNPMSQEHRIEVLYGSKYSQPPWSLGIIPSRFTKKTGAPSTSYKAIIDFMEHPVIGLLVKYIEGRHSFSTMYREGVPDEEDEQAVAEVNEEDGDDAAEAADAVNEATVQVAIRSDKPAGPDFFTAIASGLTKAKRKARRSSTKMKPGAFQRALCPDGRMHCKWNPTGQTGSRFSSSPNCYDVETEVLSSEGWLAFPEAVNRWRDPDLRFAQYDSDSEEISFTRATGAVHNSDSVLLNVLGQQIDLCGTPDHRIGTREYNSASPKGWKENRLRDLPLHRRFVHGGYYPFGRRRVGADLIRLIVAMQADGSWSNNNAVFDFKKECKYKRLRKILDACKASYSHRERPQEPKHRYQVVVHVGVILDSVRELIGPDRKFGLWLFDLCLNEVRVLLNELKFWDGRQPGTPGRWFYYSVHKINADLVQALAIMSGRRATVLHAGTCWRTQVSDTKRFSVARVSPKRHYRGDSYCLNVPTSWLIVRRHGKSLISGNCQNVAESHRVWMDAPPGRAIVYIDKEQLELRLVAVRAGIKDLLDVMRDPNGDPHMVSARKVYGEEFDRRSKKDQKSIRKVTKNVMYAGTYLAGWETVWRTCRENKRIDPELRAMMTKEMVRFTHAQLFRNLYRGIGKFHERELQLVCKQGYVEIPPFGRRRFAPLIPPDATEFANYNIQPVGSDIVGSEMCQIEWELLARFKGSAGIMLHGHDSLAVECDIGDAPEVQAIVQRIFGATYFDGPAGPVYLTATADIGTDLLSVLGSEQKEKADKSRHLLVSP